LRPPGEDVGNVGRVETHVAFGLARRTNRHPRDERVRDEFRDHPPVSPIGLAYHQCDKARSEARHVTERQVLSRGEMHDHGREPFGRVRASVAREGPELTEEEPFGSLAGSRIIEAAARTVPRQRNSGNPTLHVASLEFVRHAA
jgi:hypothetical protein